MENANQNSRRNFLTKTIKGTAVLGAGAAFLGTLIEPITGLAQGKSDADFRNRIAALGTGSLATSKLALSKATNPQVKLFAKFEVAEQEAVGQLLKDLGTTVPSPNPQGKELLANLQKLSGSAFDKTYIQGQLQAHQQLHQAVTAYANATSNVHAKHVATLALATITEHTERSQMILKQLA